MKLSAMTVTSGTSTGLFKCSLLALPGSDQSYHSDSLVYIDNIELSNLHPA